MAVLIGKVVAIPKGEWNAATSYDKYNIAYYTDGHTYIALEANNNIVPPDNPDKWVKLVDNTASLNAASAANTAAEAANTAAAGANAVKTEIEQALENGDFDGPAGPKGDDGQSPTITIGTVSRGDTAAATLTGTYPNYVLNLTLPKGDTGPTGADGQSPTLAIGTVQTGSAGSDASASMSGNYPNYELNLTIPRGEDGADGQNGMSPTFDVSKTGKVTTLTITDAEGVHTVTINDGADGSGAGDMVRATYDANENGIVDDAEKLGGQLPEHYASVDDLAEKASLPVSDTPPEDSEFWVDTGVSPTMLRRWRGADVPTGREYQQTISADTGSASLSIDNAQGQLRSVALEMGCVAKQAGSGDPSLENIRAISGRESVDVRACGKNLLPPQDTRTALGVTLTVQEDGGLHLSGTCTSAPGSPVLFVVLMGTILDGQYIFSVRNAQAIGSHLQMRLLESNNAQVSSAVTNFSATVANATNTFTLDNQYVYGWAIRIGGGETYDVTLYPQLEAGDTATAFEPYRSMGGTVTPTEPLYGLPDAKDTVEVFTDGNVTVTRRTGYIASYSDESLPGGWISSHDVYAAGTTPTTGAQVVYELAEPTTETLSPVAPIAPQPGVVNIFTDADTLSATITGSGWDTIGDMGGLEAQLAEKVDAADLATVATSGSYNDLTDKPNIAEEIDVDTTITEGGTNPVTGGAIYTALAGKADAGDIPAGLLQSAFHGTVSLLSTGWTQGDDDWYSQTVTATGVTATAIVYVAFHPDSRSAFLDAGIYCSAQAANQLTFKAASQPESNISVNVHAMEVSA